MLSISFADYDCAQRVRSLLRELGAGFDVVEKPIDRMGAPVHAELREEHILKKV